MIVSKKFDIIRRQETLSLRVHHLPHFEEVIQGSPELLRRKGVSEVSRPLDYEI